MATFGDLSQRLLGSFEKLRTKGKLSAADIDGTVREVRRALLDADVALEVVKSFTSRVRERALGDEVEKALNPAQQVVKIVDDELSALLGGSGENLSFAKNPPTVILLVGLQGAGKTTLAGKLALWLRQQGHTPVLAACDLQRPNAVDQLEKVGDTAGVPVFAPERGNGSGDPVQVARDAVVFAQQKQHSVLIVDTAGRLGVDEELMSQASHIRDAVDPDDVLFVVDSLIGQDAVNAASAFHNGVGITGTVLSKLDGDSRGGAALSVVSVTGKPILFASTGERLEDFERFHPERMSRRILDLGDVLTLIEEAQRRFDRESTRKTVEKLGADSFTLEDFRDQMQQFRDAGALKKMLALVPGASKFREQLDAFDDKEFARIEATISSMTPAERRNPRILNGSRRLRIANGAGVTVSDVNDLVSRFEQAAKTMKAMARGKSPQLPAGLLGPGGKAGALPALGAMNDELESMWTGGKDDEMPGAFGAAGSHGALGAKIGGQGKGRKSGGRRGKQARSGNPAVRAGVLPPRAQEGDVSGASFGLSSSPRPGDRKPYQP